MESKSVKIKKEYFRVTHCHHFLMRSAYSINS